MNPNYELTHMEQVADEAKLRAEVERRIQTHLVRVEQAKVIKARRRRLGRNGFSTRRMSVPGAKVAHPTRKSV